jgi:uncharacterized protein (DUF302 family)
MSATVELHSQPFQGLRLERRTPKSFDAVLSALRSRMGVASIPILVELAKRHVDEKTFVDEVTRQFVGESGFMIFDELDHGGWLSIFGVRRRTLRLIYGNPLIAVTMIRHDITAGLFAPVEMLISEAEDHGGTVVTYLRASSLMVIKDNPPLLAAALALDAKVEALMDLSLAPDS